MGHFLESLYNSQVPEPGFQLRVVYDTDQNVSFSFSLHICSDLRDAVWKNVFFVCDDVKQAVVI